MRISREAMWMQMAEAAAMRSTCFRGNIGAVIVHRNTEIVSVGYNGPPSGDVHCKGNECELNPTGGCSRSIHAEINAVERCKKRGTWGGKYMGLEGHVMYCTSSPCPDCAGLLCDHELSTFVYRHPYRITTGLEILQSVGVKVYRLTPAGILIDSQNTIVEEIR